MLNPSGFLVSAAGLATKKYPGSFPPRATSELAISAFVNISSIIGYNSLGWQYSANAKSSQVLPESDIHHYSRDFGCSADFNGSRTWLGSIGGQPSIMLSPSEIIFVSEIEFPSEALSRSECQEILAEYASSPNSKVSLDLAATNRPIHSFEHQPTDHLASLYDIGDSGIPNVSQIPTQSTIWKTSGNSAPAVSIGITSCDESRTLESSEAEPPRIGSLSASLSDRSQAMTATTMAAIIAGVAIALLLIGVAIFVAILVRKRGYETVTVTDESEPPALPDLSTAGQDTLEPVSFVNTLDSEDGEASGKMNSFE
jgi:hypothetical protein